MRPDQWQAFKKAAKRRPGAGTPVAVIVDSPWMPGYLGLNHLDYYADPDCWFQANLRIIREFPEIIFFPSWWVEYGMAAEPSALGSRISFYSDHTPDQTPPLARLDDAANLEPANPLRHGLMPFILRQYRTQRQRIRDAGCILPVVAARGPLCLAGFLRGISQFMLDIADAPDAVHALLRLTTATIIDWLKAQAEAAGDTVEGILVLDDVVGMLSRRSYQEFAHPYLQQICAAFPAEWVKVYHNDANVRPFLADLPDTGFDVLNWSHEIDVRQAREKTQGRLCLMGNVPPLDIGVRGTPEMVRQSARHVIEASGGEGLILSFGGGASPGMPGENLQALADAVQAGRAV